MTGWLTILDAACQLNISWRTVSKYVDAKRIGHREIDGIRYVRLIDIQLFHKTTTDTDQRIDNDDDATNA